MWWVQEAGYEVQTGFKADPARLVFHGGQRPTWSAKDCDDLPLYELTPDDAWLVLTEAPGSYGNGPEGRVYDLSSNPRLHRDFALIGDGADFEKDVVSFAKKNGFLGRFTIRIMNAEGKKFFGEPLSWWKDSVVVVKALIHFHLAAKGDEEHTKRFLSQWLNEDFGIRLNPRVVRQQFNLESLPAPLELYAEPDGVKTRITSPHRRRLELARALIETIANDLLSEGVEPTVDLRPGGQVQLRSVDLLAGIHVSLVTELMGHHRTPKACLRCGTFIYPENAKRVYCNDACKTAYLRRKRGLSQQSTKE